MIQMQLQKQKQDAENNVQGVQLFYKKKGIKTNFHQGFVDLNPKYTEARVERAKKLASRWQNEIAGKLLEKHEEVARDNFNNYIK